MIAWTVDPKKQDKQQTVDSDAEGSDSDNYPLKTRGRKATPDRASAISQLGADIKTGLAALGHGFGQRSNTSSYNSKMEDLLKMNTQLLQSNREQTEQLLKLSAATVELLSKLVDQQKWIKINFIMSQGYFLLIKAWLS